MTTLSNTKPEEWFYECITQYLRSPLWTAPVNDFIDGHCHEFKAGEEENKLIYTELHSQFRTLIENLLTSFIEELGMGIETLVEAVKSPNPDSPSEIELAGMILSYIVALDDYPTFRSIMEKRNAELDLEIMREFIHFTTSSETNTEDMSDEEHFLLEMAIRLSLGESDVAIKQLEVDDNAMIHEMMLQLAAEHERLFHELKDQEDLAEQQRILIERANIDLLAKREEIISAAMEMKHQKEKEAKNENKTPHIKEGPGVQKITIDVSDNSPKKQVQNLLAPIIDRRKEVFGSKAAVLPVIPKKTSSSSDTFSANSVVAQQPTFEALKKEVDKNMPELQSPSKEELEQRAEYFKKQRERLRKAKVQERANELEEFKKENKIEDGETTDLTSIKAKEMRVALARRFRDDLVQESRK